MTGSGRLALRMSGSGQEALRISGGGRETLSNVREWWESFPDVRKASWMHRSGRETLPNVQEACSDVREWLGGPF